MWIEHIGTIAMLAFLVLIALKLGVMFWFKWQKHRKQKKDAE
jgi:hypothetical protein